ncbi:polyprenyl synthetase family protein [Jannaschia seohaensis]|uniref:Geranylgeranyl diphosphate synthase n=1 Tax=Jannaschia seohaensis TaxID=475081 RepID=A0A2Y9A139_9RHOB|nr:polyprenyl synthetase family protein [Jannaschia seohaensis]PWJ21727.1 geranylgeranyl diphosphate synthase type II [Jannaschia seohaensis]SSA38005.1 geranylgeranyl diphosphate synthase, type II [Jannaschia seohaensis]
MPFSARIEGSIDRALDRATAALPPPKLAAALRHAVKPGGARIRPTILLSVASACGDDRPALSDAAGAALELIHCASLVHDDLPCFDDAATRRGKPSVHRAYGEALAVLTGDSLIVQGFDTLAEAGAIDPARAIRLTAELARYTGMPHGICAGQGWESEDQIDLATYHRAKTGALFTAATRMGAIAAGQEAEPWTELGARIGEAFQVADDLLDVLQPSAETGKPMGQDAAHDRPSAVASYGVDGAIRRLQDILSGAIASIPACPGEAMLADMVNRTAARLTPAHIATPAQ